MKSELPNLYPLAPAALHILMALAAEDLHGYGIMQEIAQQSGNRYRLGPGTLYDNLQRLMHQRLIEEAGHGRGEHSRRIYYRLTTSGRRVFSAEITRLEAMVRNARAYLNGPRPRRA
jgi:DNA-binding PadR family transcriptional regulator